MDTMPFTEWSPRRDGGHECTAGNVGLIAYDDGRWSVHLRVEYGATVCWADSSMQVPGRNLAEAKLRAKAAGRILLGQQSMK